MTGFFERSPGNRSMMRLLAFMGGVSGAMMVVTACFIGILVAFSSAPAEAATISTVLGPSGVAVFGVSEWMKQRQTQGGE